MEPRLRLASVFLIVSAVIYGVIPLIFDLDSTHLFHPDWTAHARFHLVWALIANFILAVIVAYLVLRRTPDRIKRLRVAAVLGFGPLGGFFAAVLMRETYGGVLTEPVGGIPPILGIDAGVFAFLPALLLQAAAAWLVFGASSNGSPPDGRSQSPLG